MDHFGRWVKADPRYGSYKLKFCLNKMNKKALDFVSSVIENSDENRLQVLKEKPGADIDIPNIIPLKIKRE